MAFRNFVDGVKNFFGPNNTFFNGAPEERTEGDEGGRYTPMQQGSAMQNEQPAPEQYPPQQQPQPQQQAFQQGYQPQQGYHPQAGYATPQQAYPQQNYQQPQAPQQQQMYQNSPLQQGYQPQQTVNQPYVQPRARRAAAQPQPENVVPFPGTQQPAAPQQPVQQPAPAPVGKVPAACVVNIRTIADCRLAISQLHEGDYVVAVIDNVADKTDVRRYVDTLNGACFSLNCSITRLSARVGLYLLAPKGAQVYTDNATTQMNAQSRAPQRPQRPAAPQQSAFRAPFVPQQNIYAQPQQSAYQQPYPQQNPYAPQQPVYQQNPFAAAQSVPGYAPDVDEGYDDAIL